MKSQRMEFHKLNNTRDLGGMETVSGQKIRTGKLLRSGELFEADESDIEKLESMTSLIIDLRTKTERAAHPDPKVPGAADLYLPVIGDFLPGITMEQETLQAVTEMMMDPKVAKSYMIDTYAALVTTEDAIAGYTNFLRELCKPHDRAVLWHCTAGKDRAGFAAVLIEYILGIDRDSIMEDYLYTNECLFGKEGRGPSADAIIGMLESTIDDKAAQKEIRLMVESNIDAIKESMSFTFGAREEFLQKLFDEADRIYGSFDDYLEKGLLVTAEMTETLRGMYLE